MLRRVLFRSGICLIVIVGLLALQSCSNDDAPIAPVLTASPPALPNMSTMTMDLSFFGFSTLPGDAERGTVPTIETAGTGKDNWINAAVRAFFVQLTVYAAFEAPIGAFAAAINSVPQPQSDGSYLWTFIFVEDEIEYSIFLFGKDAGDQVNWRMEVSSNNPSLLLDHFVWFDGGAMKDESSGHWQFCEPNFPSAVVLNQIPVMTVGVPSVRMDWSNTPSDEHQLTITVNGSGHEDEGDTVVLQTSPTVSSINYTDVSASENHNITWYPDGHGSLTVPDYNNGEEACWDQFQRDVLCSL